MTEAPCPRQVVVIGAGLIGTSAALALRRGGTGVWLWDRDPAAAALAADLGAGQVLGTLDGPAPDPPDLALLAVPPAEVAAVLARAQRAGLARWYTDVASVKALPLARAREAGCDISRYVPGHPLAGRERSGPAAARADLFLGRAWALCPAPETSAAAIAAVTAMVTACGAEPVVTDAATHDRWVALVSHAPHVVAAAMAAELGRPSVPPEALALAGQGLRDATRIAAGDVDLWTQILTGNAAPVAAVLAGVAAALADAARVLAGIGDGGSPGAAGTGGRPAPGPPPQAGARRRGPDPGQARRAGPRVHHRAGGHQRPAGGAGAAVHRGRRGRGQYRGRRHRALTRPAGRRGRAFGPAGVGWGADCRPCGRRMAGSPVALRV